MKLSVVVPVYNGERYIGECLDSILQNEGSEFEVVVINDGSNDSTLPIIATYATKDSRVKVYSTPGGGAANARNLGVKLSDGEYITFVDADDTISPDCLEQMVSLMETYDADFIQLSAKAKGMDKNAVVVCNQNEAICFFAQEKVFSGTIWSKIYKKTAIKELTMRGGLAEDQMYVLEALLQNQRFVCCSGKNVYFYRLNENSITHQRFGVFQQTFVDFLERLYIVVSKHAPELVTLVKQKYIMKCWSYCCLSYWYRYEGFQKYCQKYLTVLHDEMDWIRNSQMRTSVKTAIKWTVKAPALTATVIGGVMAIYRNHRNRICIDDTNKESRREKK